jgi:hypothetical protein
MGRTGDSSLILYTSTRFIHDFPSLSVFARFQTAVFEKKCNDVIRLNLLLDLLDCFPFQAMSANSPKEDDLGVGEFVAPLEPLPQTDVQR